MTEIPEHLLKRSRAAKGKGDDAPAAAASSAAVTPAKAEAASAGPPAIAAAAAAIPKDKEPAPAPPEPHYVQAAKGRNKIPMWVLPLLVLLPIWAVSFAGTMQLPPTEDLLYVDAAAVYVGCAGCHGATGGGGSGYPLDGGSVLATFPSPIDQMVHVNRGSGAISGELYGAERSDGVREAGARGVMPAHADLTLLELELVVFHERAVLSGEDTSSDEYIEWMESMRERIEAGDTHEADLAELLACADPSITPGATSGGEECAGPHSGAE